ncbi:MAG: class I SAM-dependent methyltransferase [Desulfuromonadaceae bacterium]|nr:class I SAM-dependent methyltransferase [Desulfuromonadaceae bacterium]
MTGTHDAVETMPDGLFSGHEIYENVNPRIAALYAGEKVVLDIGCGSGALGAWIKRENIHALVHGIDISPDAGITASERLDRFWCVDLDLSPLPDAGLKYDLIIMGDLLEHLKRPDLFLKQVSKFLAPGGTVIVSVPNIANYSIRLRLLCGEFRYTDTGIMDRTHLRFFTWRSFSELIELCGFSIEKRTFISRFSGPLLNIFFPLLAVQFIVTLKRR